MRLPFTVKENVKEINWFRRIRRHEVLSKVKFHTRFACVISVACVQVLLCLHAKRGHSSGCVRLCLLMRTGAGLCLHACLQVWPLLWIRACALRILQIINPALIFRCHVMRSRPSHTATLRPGFHFLAILVKPKVFVPASR